METITQSDALDKLARQLKRIDERVEVYVLPFAPHHDSPSTDNDVHIVVLLDVDDRRMESLCTEIAAQVQDINIELDFDPFVVVHPTNRNATLAQTARRQGVRL